MTIQLLFFIYTKAFYHILKPTTIEWLIFQKIHTYSVLGEPFVNFDNYNSREISSSSDAIYYF